MTYSGFVKELIGWIDSHLESRLDLTTVAERAGYSKWYLQRIFKHETGLALGEYIRSKRLQQSAERLVYGEDSILEVAISLGYDSQQSFTRSFKRQFGSTPSAWRRQKRISCPSDAGLSQHYGRPAYGHACQANG
ncbi:helix-turn-helix domain-containing protein [Biostraticola tofi]|uniref:AraC family transcriptional activator of mar-sox-rob regulon n=1 Tax=Biostraticola tofi TaxID=466109 RepID=A0A4R3YPY9_9GAMM|nr:helix-turn-helix domain-containing protein [Biostraticola tofi]TCV92983.1 AraC family transcriptional activator of mar-sox-rob regulon [Biostraticola tofi]